MVGATAFMETRELAIELRRAGYRQGGDERRTSAFSTIDRDPPVGSSRDVKRRNRPGGLIRGYRYAARPTLRTHRRSTARSRSSSLPYLPTASGCQSYSRMIEVATVMW